jgi:uncharacterized DUF497 family protein
VIEFDEKKRKETLSQRGLDMARSIEIFRNAHTDQVDTRRPYGEKRIITMGYLDSRAVVVVWTYRGNKRRIISMRKANAREISRF